MKHHRIPCSQPNDWGGVTLQRRLHDSHWQDPVIAMFPRLATDPGPD